MKKTRRTGGIKRKLKTISNTICTLLDIVGEELYWMSPRGIVYARFYGGRERRAMARIRQEEYEKKRALYELKRRKLITMQRKGHRLIVKLTKKGFYESLKHRMKTAPPCPPGEYVFVTFDIPNAIGDVRDQLRYTLRMHDFKMLHQSVWYSRLDVYDLFQVWVQQSKARPWVYIFRGSGLQLLKPMRKKL